MKRTIMLFGFIALVALVAAGCGGESVTEDEKKVEVAKIIVKKAQTHCPIMGNPVDKEAYFDYEGQRIYFCCPPCIDKFKEDPEGYVKEMEAQGIGFERVEHVHDHGEHGHDHSDHDHGETHDQGEDHDHDKDHGHDHGGHDHHDHG